MNVIRPDNNFVPLRGRSRHSKGRGRLGTLTTHQQVINLVPKYQIPERRRPLVNLHPSSSSTPVTPKGSNRRGYGTTTTTSSSLKRNSARGRNTTDSGTGKITTPGSLSDGQEAFIIMAITSGRGDARGEVGLAVMDVMYPHMVLSQISDCHSYVNTLTKIHTFDPVEILMPDTICDDTNILYSTVKERFNDMTITAIPRMHFIDTDGLDRIRIHCATEFSSVELVVHQKYYALAAAAALMKYIEFIQHIQYLPKTMRIEYQVSQNTTMIDIESAQSLELVMTNGGQHNYSLFGALDRCSTPIGRRLLRASILQPPCDIDLIKRRQLCIQELISNRSLHSIIQPVVRRLSGVNRLLSLAMHTQQVDNVLSAERNLNYVLLLKNTVEIVPELRATLNPTKATFFRKVHTDLNDQRFEMMKKKILEIIHPNARSVMGYTSANMQRCFAINSGINDMLDVARQTYCELIDDMEYMVKQLGEKYNLPLALVCNMSLGYHIQMDEHRNNKIKIDELPKEFIQIRKLKNSLLMTTEPLVVLSQNCSDACDELHLLSDALLKKILIEVREHIGSLYNLSDNIAELDLILSLAQISSISDYTMPTFGSKLELRASKHPVMDIWAADHPIPNDVIASVSYNFQTITGPNMSGKTIYLKQIVLLHIMAQIGCYVPATKAEFRIADNIFCRLGIRDDIEYDASTFTLEIKEVHYILQSITPSSLVVLDELCCSTTVEEGSSIAWVICKNLAMTSAFTFHATHFVYLLQLPDLYPNITNYYMEAMPSVVNDESDSPRLIYTHQLKKGISPIRHYGIILARATNFPASILKSAQEIANQIVEQMTPTDVDDKETSKILITQRKKNYDTLALINEKLENAEENRKEIIELVRKIEIIDHDLIDVSEKATTASTSTIKNEPQLLINQHIPENAAFPSTQHQSSTKRLSTFISLSSISKPKIPKFSSQQPEQSNKQFKLPREPLRSSQKASKPKVHDQNSSGAILMAPEAKNILKNPTTDPDSPLFVPPSDTCHKSLELSTRDQTISKTIESYASNLDSEMKDIINDNDEKISPINLDTRHLLLPIPSTDRHDLEFSNADRLHIEFENNNPNNYNYLRHILKNIDDNTYENRNSTIQNGNEFFFSSDPVTRRSNSILVDHHNSLIDGEKLYDQMHPVSPIKVHSNMSNSSTDRDLSLLAAETSFKCIPTANSSYATIPSQNLFISPSNSQTSIDTVLARRLAREKEAEIFRLIEGSAFDEKNFFNSPRSVISLGSSSYKSENNGTG